MSDTDYRELSNTRVSVKFEDDRSYGTHYAHLTARLVYWRGDRSEWLSFGDWTDERHYQDLTVRAQRDAQSGHWYGYDELEYRSPYRVTADRAALMVKTLRRLQAKLDKMAAELGYPSDLAAYLARFAVAVGAQGFLRHVGRGTSEDFSGTGYREMNPDALAYWIDQQVRAAFPADTADV